jgi:polyisoprenyl-teichoic acid--peptidoglycan teichoic acid transferase
MSIGINNSRKKSKGFIGFLIVFACIGLGIFVAYQFIMPRLMGELALKKPMVLLLIGNVYTQVSDKNSLPKIDNKLVLVIVDPASTKISLVSIPGDTLVDIPRQGLGKINDARSLGEEPLAKTVVSGLTGYKINRYMALNLESLKEFIDLLGGVMIDVEEELYNTNDPATATIKLAPGVQVLDGTKALQYIRFFSKSGDSGKNSRVRKLMISAAKKSVQPVNIVKAPEFLKLIHRQVKTNLTTQEISQLMYFTRKINSESGIASYILPGSYYETYWKVDPAGVQQLMKKLKPKNAKW